MSWIPPRLSAYGLICHHDVSDTAGSLCLASVVRSMYSLAASDVAVS